MNTEGARTPRQEEQEICGDSDLNLRIQDPGLRKKGGREKASESRAWAPVMATQSSEGTTDTQVGRGSSPIHCPEASLHAGETS